MGTITAKTVIILLPDSSNFESKFKSIFKVLSKSSLIIGFVKNSFAPILMAFIIRFVE